MDQRRTLSGAFCLVLTGLWFMIATAPVSLAADSDGDGVDDSIDCRPSDVTTWSASTQARNLAVTGGAATSFSWLPPSPGPGQTVYDVLRSNGSASWASAVCLLSNTTSLSAINLDPTTPSDVYFYLVRAKTACGGQLGESSNGIPITGTSCSAANGSGCSVSAACSSGYCCTGNCRDVASDVLNCGGCGNVCSVAHGTPGCTGGTCVIGGCSPPFANCDGFYPNGCETDTSSTATHCSACGNVCPGLGQPTDDVACSASSCTFTCRGENYDVDSNPSNGCEFLDNPQGNHTSGSAVNLGSHDCFDGTFSYSGTMLSDARTHANPVVTGFDGPTGSAPDWDTITATGGPFCTNDLNFTLTTSGGGPSVCYRLTVFTSVFPAGVFCTTGGSSACNVTRAASAYGSNTSVSFRVDKICNTTIRERVTYTVLGHL